LKTNRFSLAKGDSFAAFLKSLLPFYGPTGEAEGSRFTLLRDEGGLSALNLSLTNTNMPPKCLIFPQTEAILTYSADDAEERPCPIDGPGEGEGIVALGIRPCDARAFDTLDSHFIDYGADPRYAERRARSVLLGVSCLEPGPNCFCPSVGGGPFSNQGLDALFTDLGDAWLIEVLTERGAKALEGKAGLKAATDAQVKKRDEAERRAMGLFEREFELAGVKESLELDNAEAVWKELAGRCVGCGACSYLCPTCYCFLVYNDELRGEGRRVRTWTSCQFPKFIFQATGTNLRPDKVSRIKRRIWDKYKEYPDRFGKVACMGCGRCIEACPVDLDIIEVVNAVKEHGADLLMPVFTASEGRETVPLSPAKEKK